MDDLLERLEHWYAVHCNGEWEHTFGVNIETIDNPGWMLSIDLFDTTLHDEPFERLETERADDDWVHCWVEDNAFKAACGPRNLREALRIFVEWAEGTSDER